MGRIKRVVEWSLASRKFAVLVISAALLVANDLTGRRVDQDTVWTVIGLVSAWLIGQGIADHGAQGRARAEARAEARTNKASGAAPAGARVLED